MDNKNPTRLFADKILAERLGIGRSTLWKLVKLGKIPPPIKIPGTRCSRWPESVIEEITQQ